MTGMNAREAAARVAEMIARGEVKVRRMPTAAAAPCEGITISKDDAAALRRHHGVIERKERAAQSARTIRGQRGRGVDAKPRAVAP